MPGLSLIYGTGPADILLIDVPNTGTSGGPVFQRTAGQNSGPARVSYTYTGRLPLAEGQVRLVSDGSVHVPWTPLASRSESGGVGFGLIPSLSCVPGGQCGPYTMEIRRGDNITITSRGALPFSVGDCFLMYGQSNMGVMTHTDDGSSPAALAGTAYYGSTPVDSAPFLGWGGSPSGNGIREILNGLKTALGVPVAAINCAIAASDASFLLVTNWPNIVALIQAMTGGDLAGMLWNQGENNTIGSSSNLPAQTQREYHNLFLTAQANLMALTGRAAADVPIIVSSLATEKPPTLPDARSSIFWPQQQRNLVKLAEQPSMFFSHARTSLAVGIDGLHINGTDCGKSGKWYAHDVAVAKGVGSGMSNWRVTGAAIASATTTTVSLQHSLGTDFTPTAGIVGFELSFDGGATWVVPTAAVRVDSVTILLTHSLANTKNRLVRYLWNWTPWSANGVYAANVYDNSANVCPLGFTEDWITCSGGTVTAPVLCLPQPRFAFDNGTLKATTTSHIGIGAASATRMLIVGVAQGNTLPTSVTVTPYSGDEVNPGAALTPVSLTKVAGVTSGCSIWKEIVPGGLSCLVEAQYAANPTSGIGFLVWRVDSSLMNLTTPVDAQRVAFIGGATSATLNIATSADGFVTVISDQQDAFASLSGTEAYCFDFLMPVSFFGGGHSAVNAVNAASAVTVTLPTQTASSGNTIVAASWR